MTWSQRGEKWLDRLRLRCMASLINLNSNLIFFQEALLLYILVN